MGLIGILLGIPPFRPKVTGMCGLKGIPPPVPIGSFCVHTDGTGKRMQGCEGIFSSDFNLVLAIPLGEFSTGFFV